MDDLPSNEIDVDIERQIAAAERHLAYLERMKAKYAKFSMYSERRFVRDEATGKHVEVKGYHQ